jgi:hypothetical protein
VVLAIGHSLRAHEALSRLDALPGFLEVVHRLFENDVFISHKRRIRVDSILRRVDGPGYPTGCPDPNVFVGPPDRAMRRAIRIPRAEEAP